VAWTAGDGERALAASDSVLAYQSDNPEGLRARAAALALLGKNDEAFALYEKAVRERTGVAELRCDFARDLLRAGRTADAVRQLDEAALLDEENATAEALRAWAALASGDVRAARRHADRARAWGPWSDLASIVDGAVARREGRAAAAEAAWAPVRARIAREAPPEYVYRPKISTWERTHALPAVERRILEGFASNGGTRL
jgi:tetratricopeptide (TPR) repeat protein